MSANFFVIVAKKNSYNYKVFLLVVDFVYINGKDATENQIDKRIYHGF